MTFSPGPSHAEGSRARQDAPPSTDHLKEAASLNTDSTFTLGDLSTFALRSYDAAFDRDDYRTIANEYSEERLSGVPLFSLWTWGRMIVDYERERGGAAGVLLYESLVGDARDHAPSWLQRATEGRPSVQAVISESVAAAGSGDFDALTKVAPSPGWHSYSDWTAWIAVLIGRTLHNPEWRGRYVELLRRLGGS